MSSVQDWYNFILDKMPIESNRAMRIKNLTNLASILGQDLREGCNASHDQFQASLNVNYKQLCFRQANWTKTLTLSLSLSFAGLTSGSWLNSAVTS